MTLYLWKKSSCKLWLGIYRTPSATELATPWFCQRLGARQYSGHSNCHPKGMVFLDPGPDPDEGTRELKDPTWGLIIVKYLHLYKLLLFIWVWRKAGKSNIAQLSILCPALRTGCVAVCKLNVSKLGMIGTTIFLYTEVRFATYFFLCISGLEDAIIGRWELPIHSFMCAFINQQQFIDSQVYARHYSRCFEFSTDQGQKKKGLPLWSLHSNGRKQTTKNKHNTTYFRMLEKNNGYEKQTNKQKNQMRGIIKALFLDKFLS